MYGFCDNDSVNHVDPDGTIWLGAAVGGTMGIGVAGEWAKDGAHNIIGRYLP